MSNPFDNTEGRFHVLVNDAQEYSLWPTFASVPQGWRTVLADATHEQAVDYVEEHWTTLTPAHYSTLKNTDVSA